jgi:thiamine biosynthesis lipoprotein
VRLTISGSPDDAAACAWAAVRAEFDAVDRSLSRFRNDSELTWLNRGAGSGAIVPVSRRLRIALALVDRAVRVTCGRFDAGILDTLERLGEHGARLERDPDTPLAVSLAERTSRVHVPPVPLDRGGVGKGLALRWAGRSALYELPPGAGLLLEAGGDLIATGEPPEGAWLVGIEDPVAAPGADTPPIVVLALAAGAVATSSIRVRNWIGPDGRPVHHLVDPVTREPARTGLLAVTVAHDDPAWAEIWSKALFMTGREGIAREARARGLPAWWVDDRGHLGMTPDARVRTAWAAEERLG